MTEDEGNELASPPPTPLPRGLYFAGKRETIKTSQTNAENSTLSLYLETQNSLRNYTGVKVFFSWPGPHPPAADGSPQAVVLPGNRRSRGESLPLARPPPRVLMGCHSSLSLSLF